jgi:aryl-alcohol dehydrogenase-like predicted oxidoreductase
MAVSMDTRRLGTTDLTVSRIGLGLAAIGRPGYITLGRAADLGEERSIDALRERCHVLLDAAWAHGIRYLDAARSYGLAESFLASWLELRGRSRDELTVGSKWGYTYTAGWQVGAAVNEVKDHSLAAFRRQVGESTALLGPWLRLYQVHSATLESGILADAAVHRELARTRAGGLAMGLSVSGPRQADTIRAALEVRVDGERLFDAVQATWNVLEPSAGDALAEAHDAGLGVIVKEALANGRLVTRDGELVRSMAEVGPGDESGPVATADAIAIAAVLAQPWADVVLSGAVTADQVRSNVGALEVRLGPERLAALTGLAEQPEVYWRSRSALPWT